MAMATTIPGSPKSEISAPVTMDDAKTISEPAANRVQGCPVSTPISGSMRSTPRAADPAE